MKKHFLLIIAIFMLCSCSTDNNTSTSALKTDADGTMQSSISASTTLPNESNNLDDSILLSHEDWLEKYGYLYDFDFDGINEVFLMDYALIGEVSIYKIIDNDAVLWGESIKFNSIHPEWFTVEELTLYYDKKHNEYFYVAEYDMWEKYFNSADVNKYTITANGLVQSNIAHCEFDYATYGGKLNFLSNQLLGIDATPLGLVNWEDITHYYDGVDEYLSQFEKIKTITFEELTENSFADTIN